MWHRKLTKNWVGKDNLHDILNGRKQRDDVGQLFLWSDQFNLSNSKTDHACKSNLPSIKWFTCQCKNEQLMLHTTDGSYYYEAAESWRGTHTPVSTALHRTVFRIITFSLSWEWNATYWIVSQIQVWQICGRFMDYTGRSLYGYMHTRLLWVKVAENQNCSAPFGGR
jgi:hypothetical protein